MRTGSTGTGGAVDPAIAAAIAEWAREPGLARALGDPDGAYLVLDPGDGRVLHASPAARALAEALPDGPALARQVAWRVAWPGAGGAGPRLARLRLDARRIAPPTLCVVARGVGAGGEPLVLVVPTAPVAPPRAGRLAPATPSVTPPAAGPADRPTEEPSPAAGDRFLWRSDAAGALTALTGADGLARLVGRSWEELARAGVVEFGPAMLAALRERCTFRAEPLRLDLGAGPVAVELSGAPLGRGAAAFSGFGGFGTVREAAPGAAPGAGAATPDDGAAPAAAARSAADVAPPPEPSAPEPATPEPAPLPGPLPGPGAGLSTDEHAAFREIARALGARYAGDEPTGEPRGPAEGAAVMPFPGPAAAAPGVPQPGGPPQAGPDPEAGSAAIAAARKPSDKVSDGAAALLAGLPLPALLHRGGAILAANRPMLDLTGHADLAALAAAGLGGLFRGVPPTGPRPDARRTAVAAADGRPIPVEALRGAEIEAGGAAGAACLVLRPLGAEDRGGALAAERLAREAQAARAADAEAALDALPQGVVALDGAGRVLALNRAAAALFGCDPREVVGGRLSALLDAPDIAPAGLPEGPAAPRPVSASGRALTLGLSAPRADGRRIAIVVAAPAAPAPTPAEAASGRPEARGLLARLDRDLRAPAAAVVALAESVLGEPFGPLGDGRYRESLGAIREAGGRMVERAGELLDLAAVEAGALALDPRPLALNDVVAGCVARLQPEAARGRIVMRTSFSADLAEPEADERSVSRAASLVIEHAIRRSAAGAQVIVSTGAVATTGVDGGSGVALRVRDTGAAPTRADPSAGRRKPGDGDTKDRDAEDRDADLALPRALVEANGGRLRLSGRTEEEGTLVEIVLPARRAG